MSRSWSNLVAAGDPANVGDQLAQCVRRGPRLALAVRGAQLFRSGLPARYSSRRALRALLAGFV